MPVPPVDAGDIAPDPLAHHFNPNLSIHFSPYIIPPTLPSHFQSSADVMGSAMGSSRDPNHPMSLRWLDLVWLSLRSRASSMPGSAAGSWCDRTCVRSTVWFGVALRSNVIEMVRSALGLVVIVVDAGVGAAL